MAEAPVLTAAVFGTGGGIGRALADTLASDPAYGPVLCLSRTSQPSFDLTDEASIAAAATAIAQQVGTLDLIVVATGALIFPGADGRPVAPEKSLRQLDPAAMAATFAINAIGPALLLKHFGPLLPRDRRGVFALLSARVGSIGDNRLGGWVSYRASKAALNQIVRTAAIEIARRHPLAVVAALHPGTVATPLSAPFAGGRETFAPAESAARLLAVLAKLGPTDSGGFFAYDGSNIPW
jgi:NAD(P)-dependent dehydrogenase (short-subunit alcohol dehydrogenase family)